MWRTKVEAKGGDNGRDRANALPHKIYCTPHLNQLRVTAY